MVNHSDIKRKCILLFLLITFLPVSSVLKSQATVYNYYYRVWLKDKGENSLISYLPEQLLSSKAIERRKKSGIPVPDIYDIPVSSIYIEGIEQLGFRLHCTSRWMNTALFKTISPADTRALLALSFVEKVRVVKTPSSKSVSGKLDFPMFPADDPFLFDRPLTLLNGLPLHRTGFTGKNILIAVLDAGFIYADKASSLSEVHRRKGIRSTYDFISRNSFVYGYHNHGTSVLSVLAGTKEGVIAGTAPSADYILLRTEDNQTEFPVEEDFWAAGAEFADSAGADIISSSLGYFRFDDPSMNYKYSDMNGRTAFVTRAAEIAASRGMLVFASAGNERNNPWKRIIAPSDGEHVMAAGAVDALNVIASFSSAGPSADGRIKPDNTAMGVRIPVQPDRDTVVLSSGTSFSCPVLSGMAACLLQAVPGASAGEIMDAFHRSGDRFLNPDSLYGYGTPDMVKALAILQEKYEIMPAEEAVVVTPNPSSGGIDIIFSSAPGELMIEVFTASGRSVLRKSLSGVAGRIFHLDEFSRTGQGIYFIRLTTGNDTFVKKVIKLN